MIGLRVGGIVPFQCSGGYVSEAVVGPFCWWAYPPIGYLLMCLLLSEHNFAHLCPQQVKPSRNSETVVP